MLPDGFLKEVEEIFETPAEREEFLSAIEHDDAPVSVRLNPLTSVDRSHFIGLADGISSVNSVPWCENGIYLPVRPGFTFDPVFWGGGYYPQEASSMIVGKIVSSISPSRILDLCAAPGGKTTHIATSVSENTLVVANEVIASRAKILAENVQRWGTGNVVVTQSDPASFSRMDSYFDMIVADVPCSGEGMFRKDSSSIEEWSMDSVNLCASRSRRIISDVWNALAPGGHLLLSTCTYNSMEDEDNVRFIVDNLGARQEDISALMPEGTVSYGYGYHFFPHKIKGEGFFAALLRKTDSAPRNHDFYSRNIRPLQRTSKSDEKILSEFSSRQLRYFMISDQCYGADEILFDELDYLRRYVNVIYAGVNFGRIIAGKLKPSQMLATYKYLSYSVISDLSMDESIRYLRRDVQSPELFQKGLSVVRYEEVALGWANCLSNRVNNLYPSSQRILSSVSQ